MERSGSTSNISAGMVFEGTSSAMASKLKRPCAGYDPVLAKLLGVVLSEAGVPAAAVACDRLALGFDGGRNRLVLKSIISTSKPSSFAAGVISSLSMVPVRIPRGLRRRKHSSLQRPGDEDLGFRISDFESADSPVSRCAAVTRWNTSLAR